MFSDLALENAIEQSDIIVVGSGFFGATIAQQAAELNNWKVLVLEKRENVGGNAYSFLDPETGIEIHKYGTHLFHTNNEEVWTYLNRFTKFNDYRHKVITNTNGMSYPFPINLQTMSMVYGHTVSPAEARLRFKPQIELQSVSSFKEAALNFLPEIFYQKFYEGYTKKQWQQDPSELSSEIFSRIPIRFDYNEEYFSDKFQGLPLEGYSKIFEKMLDSDFINVKVNTDFFDLRALTKDKKLIFTGPIDQYFNYTYGALDWRTLDFQFETVNLTDYQGCSVMNYPDEIIPYTRIHEFKHLHPERNYEVAKTVVAQEFSRIAESGDEPFYPINTHRNREILQRYRTEAKKLPNVIFGGRLGTYQYLDMHMAIASALSVFRNQLLEIRSK